MGFSIRNSGHRKATDSTTPVPSDLDLLAINLKGAHSEVHPNGILLSFCVDAGLEMLHHTRLPHVGIPDKNDLEEVVKVLVGCPSQTGELHGSHT